MKKITNTSKTSHLEWLMGGNPNAIEAQEAQGQQELVESSQLPLRCNYPRDFNVIKQYLKMGIDVVENSKEDDLFIDVKLPEGWKLESTDHSMWNRLVDNKGRERATIFYKAAFYDRDAFINFNHRYLVSSEYVEKEEGDKFHPKFYCVKDNTTNEILFQTEVTKEYDNYDLRKKCEKWIKKHYPKYEDLNAYWD